MTKRNKILSVSIFLFFVFCIIYNVFTCKRLERDGIYSIATIEKVEGARSGKMVHLSYKYQNKTVQNSYIEDVTRASKNDVGKRVFIKFRPTDPDGDFDLIEDKPVPDSIKEAPVDGWEKLPL
jgi:hypothetical protein